MVSVSVSVSIVLVFVFVIVVNGSKITVSMATDTLYVFCSRRVCVLKPTSFELSTV